MHYSRTKDYDGMGLHDTTKTGQSKGERGMVRLPLISISHGGGGGAFKISIICLSAQEMSQKYRKNYWHFVGHFVSQCTDSLQCC